MLKSVYKTEEINSHPETSSPDISAHWHMDHDWLARFEALLPSVTAVSLDVFDTALTRTLDAPVDVFALVEKRLVQQHGPAFVGYAAWRETAEREAREKAARKGQKEITFTEILDALVARHGALGAYRQAFSEMEIKAEHECCFAVPEIRAAFELCRKKNIPVLFVSDMYLPSSVIRSLLENAGYAAPELIVSCETGRTKWDGSQWDIVRQEFGAGTKALHIGDNHHSDGITAEKAGFLSLLFKRVRSNHRNGGPLTPSVLPFSRLLRGEMLARKPEGENYDPTHLSPRQTMALLGSSWGGLVVGSYVNWIADRARTLGVSHIYFCARDGWLPQQAWYTAGLDKATGISSSYLHVSRRSLNFAAAAITCTRDYLSEQALQTLCHVFRDERLHDVLARGDLLPLQPLVDDVLTHFGSLDRRICWSDGVKELQNCMLRHTESIYPVLQSKLFDVVSYLCQEGLHKGKVAIVDVGWHGNMQVSMCAALENAGYKPMIYGLYAGLWPGAQRNRHRAGWMEGAFWNDYQPFNQGYGLHNNVAIIENTFSSNEGTTLRYKRDGEHMAPVLAESDQGRSHHEALLMPFQKQALKTIRDLCSGATCHGITVSDMTLASAFAAINRLGLSPSESEITAVGSIRHSGDPGHATLTPIVRELSEDTRIRELLDLDQCDWIVGSALTILRHTACPQKRAQLATAFRHKLNHYDARTLGQFT